MEPLHSAAFPPSFGTALQLFVPLPEKRRSTEIRSFSSLSRNLPFPRFSVVARQKLGYR
jgi:hypothetical protein